MKTQFMECNDINCMSEFDPALSYIAAFLRSEKGLGSIRAYNLCSSDKMSSSISCALIEGGYYVGRSK
jgi:hypothetical protein